jgi:hypothetical protein
VQPSVDLCPVVGVANDETMARGGEVSVYAPDPMNDDVQLGWSLAA